MIFYYLDASAWVKRYYLETGTPWIQALFDSAPTVTCASLGLVEGIGSTLGEPFCGGRGSPGACHVRSRTEGGISVVRH